MDASMEIDGNWYRMLFPISSNMEFRGLIRTGSKIKTLIGDQIKGSRDGIKDRDTDTDSTRVIKDNGTKGTRDSRIRGKASGTKVNPAGTKVSIQVFIRMLDSSHTTCTKFKALEASSTSATSRVASIADRIDFMRKMIGF